MKNYAIRSYESNDYEMWNAFIAKAKNATFLFHRDFMDYHKEKFDDFSLLVFDKKKLIAVLPANKKGNEVFSHQGLTYGGLVYEEKMKIETVLLVFKELLYWLHDQKITRLSLKPIPAIYHAKPAGELEYALFLANGRLYRRDTLSVIDMSKTIQFTDSRKAGISKGIENGLEIREVDDLVPFWNRILIPNLKAKYGVAPVHSIGEITDLKSRFPNNIRQFNVYHNKEIVGGTTIFQTGTVAHSQYISANETRKQFGSLDFLYAYLLTDVFKDMDFFDFGTSNEQNGLKLNAGLAFWKSGFGASAMCQDFYEVETSDFAKLNDVFI